MVIQTITASNCQPQTIVIGRRGTYDTLQIAFDLNYLVDSYGNGVAVLAVKRSQDESAYPAVTSQADNTLTWTISETDTARVGAGECQLMWYVDGGLAKTIIYPMVVMRDILATSEEAPDAYENWVESLTALGAETLRNAQNAAQSASEAESAKDDSVTAKEASEEAARKAEEASAHAPIIVNGYWYSWDAETETYQNTGVKAEGRDGTDGFSPVITVTDITGGHRVTITDADGAKTVDVMNGTDGTDGDDGYSPVVTVTNITGGHRVTITDKTHPTGQSFDVMDGQDGASDAGEVTYDETATYPSGSVGAALTNQKNATSQKQDAPSTAGTAGQVLGLDDQLNPVWIGQTGGEDAPHNYAFDGTDLSTVFADADALQAALAAEDYSKIHVGDYWPVTLNGTFRDYGQATIPTGTTYYSDAACETEAGTTAEEYTGIPSNDSNYPGGWKTSSFKIGSATYYVLADDCLPYLERTLTNALMLFEVCGINQYWRYAVGGADKFYNGKPHLVMWSRDGLPTTLKMRKANEIWEDTVIDTFTGDGTTSVFTMSGTVGTIGYVFVGGVRKTYNTDYTYASNKITFKAGKIPATDAVIKVEWMEAKAPWTGSALYKTFNDPDYGILKLIQTADVKLYNHIYKGNNNQGMQYYAETRSKTNQQSNTWEDRGILFLPTEDEIWGRLLAASSEYDGVNMTQWPIFVGGRRHFAKGPGNAAARYRVWCASSSSTANFANIYDSGNPTEATANFPYVAVPGFLLL